MPELPDVQVYKEYFDSTSLNKEIESMNVLNKKVLEKTTDAALRGKLSDNSVAKTRRHGKYLFAETRSKAVLMMHFGMTGNLKYFKNEEEEQ